MRLAPDVRVPMERWRRGVTVGTAVALAVLLVSATILVVRSAFFSPKTITAYFTSATGIYPGDKVQVAGVKVGRVATVEPQGTQAKLTLHVDHGVPIPADAKAVIVAQNLVAARYVQLAPAYEVSGPQMPDGAVIPIGRTAVPVEWDEVKSQLMRLATELGPKGDLSSTSVSRFIDSAANAMDGNGDKLRQTLGQMSAVGRILADGSSDIADIIANLATFVTALRDSNAQIVEFEDHLASLSSVVNGARSDLDRALTDLSIAVGEVQQFVAETRDKTSEQIQRLTNVTQNLVDHRNDVENILHVAPNSFANGYNIYNPDTGSPLGAFLLHNFSSPVSFICDAIGAIQNVTAPETAKLCGQYLGPGLRTMSFNYPPFPFNPVLMRSANPDNIVYADPSLAPGGAGPAPGPPEEGPAVSAYTGVNGDAATPASGPSGDSPPSEPPVSATSLPEMLLPAEAVPSTVSPQMAPGT